MALNREQKRQMRKGGDVTGDGAGSPPPSDVPAAAAAAGKPPPSRDPRVGPAEFIREVRAELRKVAWPTKAVTLHYSLIVFIALVLVTAMVFAIDWLFSNAVLKLFEVS